MACYVGALTLKFEVNELKLNELNELKFPPKKK